MRIARPTYLAAVEPFIDQPLVKVLTGLRRSGKSTLLRLIGTVFERAVCRPSA